jgi:hypothetical protein
MRTPAGWDPTTPVNMIIATDGSVTFGVGYHRWVVDTEAEDILLQGGGPDNGDLFLMQSYRSELEGVAVGITVLGTSVGMAASTKHQLHFCVTMNPQSYLQIGH